MLRFSRLFAAFVAATLMALTFAPARAAGIPASSALVLEQAGRVEAGWVRTPYGPVRRVVRVCRW